MSDEILKRDQNTITVLGGVTDDSNQYITMLRVDPTTKRLLVSATGLGSGSVTSVSVVTANGVSGSVANPTTTPAITLTLGAITPTSVNGASSTEVGYLVGVTSAIQTQLNSKGTGNGTVTSVGIATANGVSGSGAITTSGNITITLGAITPTTVNGNTFTTGSYTLTGTAGKTLNFTNTLTLSGTDSTTMTFPSTSATIARTDAANTFTGVQTFSTPIAAGSVATMTATVGGGVPTPPNNTTTFLRGDGTFAAPSGASFTPTMNINTAFETAARFTTNGGSGTATYGGFGVTLNTTATGTRYVRTRMTIGDSSAGGTTFQPYKTSPTFNCMVTSSTLPTTGESYFGIGGMTGNGTAMVYTQRHIGFKILVVAGVASLYATQGDNTTETASSALTTIVAGDVVNLSLKVNGTSSVDYYWSLNGGAWSSATNLTTNMPSTSTGDATVFEFIVANKATANDFQVTVSTASYTQ